MKKEDLKIHKLDVSGVKCGQVCSGFYNTNSDESFSSFFKKLDHIEKNILVRVQMMINQKHEQDRKNAAEIQRYVIGTIILGIISIAISLLK